MPICVKCSNSFPSRIEINGKRYNLYTRKYCLTCSPYGQHNTRRLAFLSETKLCICQFCKREFEYDRKKGHQYRTCNTCVVQSRWAKLKQKCVDYLGGKCAACGYSRCLRALDFHHTESGNKKFSIGGCYNRSWKVIKAELDKCILYCSNCHREHHDKNFE
jgi:hypothetical protein